jgi:peptidase A4-like protein
MHDRLPRFLARVLVACLPVLGLSLAFAPTAGAATNGSHASQYARALAAARAYLKHLSVGDHATDHRVPGHAAQIYGLTQVQSTNWSGYADDNTGSHTYSTVTGHWTEPSVSCTSTTALAAFWVGIDGFTSGSVEQDGTLAECSGGTAFYFTWWEMYPRNSIQVVGQSLAPGDSITASVVRSGTSYTLKVTDSTHTANSFTTTQRCSNCKNTSAEWIAEAPSGSGGIFPLPNFGTWSLSSATVTSGSTSGVISTFPDDELTMVNSSGAVKAQPSALNSAGNGFSVAWKRST